MTRFHCDMCSNEIDMEGPFATAKGTKGLVYVDLPFMCGNCNCEMKVWRGDIVSVAEGEIAEGGGG